MNSIYKRFIPVCIAVLISSSATAGLLATFEGTIASGTYNGLPINGETMTVTSTISDNATVLCSNDCSVNSYFLMSDPEIQNSISISGPNGGTFFVDVFYNWNFIILRDDPVWGDDFAIILGDVNSYHFRSLGREIFGPGDNNFTGNVADVGSLILLNSFPMPEAQGQNATTIEGGGNTLFLSPNALSNQSGTLTGTGSEDSDGDGVSDDEDNCPDSDLSETIVIDGCDSGVSNFVFEGGCTLADFINGAVTVCALDANNHGQFVSCMAHFLNDLLADGAITEDQKDALQSCAGRSSIGKSAKGGKKK